MIFSEPRFLFFFALVFGVHWLLRGNLGRKIWLLGASLFFYGSWDWRFLALILGCAVVDYICAKRIQRARDAGRDGKPWLIFSLCYDLGTLAFFKYFNFFADSGVDFLQWLGIPASEVTLQILLPVGISFFTFQAMSYTIDVYRGSLKPAPHFLDFVLFVTFFPQLVAGPIVRAADFLPQLERIVAPGGELRIVTDHPDYAEWVEEVLRAATFERIDYRPPVSAGEGELVGTNFERKYRIRDGRAFHPFALRSPS